MIKEGSSFEDQIKSGSQKNKTQFLIGGLAGIWVFKEQT